MGKKKQNFVRAGFTIVEVTLFLGISSLLAVGLMVGWTNNINRQRYNDTINTFKSSVQQAFTYVENTQNGRQQKYTCTTSGSNVALATASSGTDRGTTNCILLGKMITFSPCDADKSCSTTPGYSTGYSIRDVIGMDINIATACGTETCSNDIDAFKATKFIVSSSKSNDTGGNVSETLEWDGAYKAITRTSDFSGSLVGKQIGSQAVANAVYGVLILRSPIDGTVRTFGVPVNANNDNNDQIYANDTARQSFRENIISENTLITKDKKIDVCIASKSGNSGTAEVSIYGRNRVLTIGNNTGSVELLPMDGTGSASCDGQAGFNGINRG